MTTQYPKDEFDLAGDDMPVGMHRPEPSRWRNVIPFLIILIAVPVLAWTFSNMLIERVEKAQSGTHSAQSVAQAPQSDAAQSAPTVEVPQSEVPQSEPSEPVQPEAPQSEPQSLAAQVNYNVAVEVLNGTGINGLAAEKSSILNQAGFPGTTASNANGWLTQVSTVYYRSPEVEVTAREIARQLGIDAVQNEPDLDSNADIVVVLK